MQCHTIVSLFYLCTLMSQALGKGNTKSIQSALEVQCPPCDKIGCTTRNPRRLNCRGGITRGVCNCCLRCARLEGETCGGHLGYLGQCDVGLYCDVTENQVNQLADESMWGNFELEGICRTIPVKEVVLIDAAGGYGMQNDQPDISGALVLNDPRFQHCRPACTPEFCEKNPRDICSARSNAELRQGCQGDCQHTSCRACRYVYEDNDCPKCGRDDFRCLKRYGTCIRQQQCHKDRFPCKQDKKSTTHLAGTPSFVCKVPECS